MTSQKFSNGTGNSHIWTTNGSLDNGNGGGNPITYFNVTTDSKSNTAILTRPEIQQLAAAGQIVTGQNGQLFVMVPNTDPPSTTTGTSVAGLGNASSPASLRGGPSALSLGSSSSILVSGGNSSSKQLTANGTLQSSASLRPAANLKDGHYNSPPTTLIRRKVNHNEVERRRRDQINSWITELNGMLPLEEQQKSQHQSKGAILRRVCEYFRGLEDRLKQLEEENQAIKEDQEEKCLMEENIRQLELENGSLKSQLLLVGLTPACMSTSSSVAITSSGVTPVLVSSSLSGTSGPKITLLPASMIEVVKSEKRDSSHLSGQLQLSSNPNSDSEDS